MAGAAEVVLDRIIARAWDEEILFSVLLELTFACNLDCFFCYNDLGSSGTPLKLADYERLLEELAEMGVMNVTLSGGEPLAHRDFFAIGRRARELGFVQKIKSNGHALNAEVAQRLRSEVDPFVVELSLHGATAETHERQTRVEGSFDRLVSNIEAAVAAGLRVKLNSTVTRWNEHEIEGMFALADRLGARLAFNHLVSPRDDGDRAPLDIAATDEGLKRLFELLRQRAGSEAPQAECDELPSVSKICGAGSSGVAVDPFGEVFPCVQWRRSLGNVRNTSVREIWERSPVLAEVRGLSRAAKLNMDGFAAAGRESFHCMGLSEALTGDPLEVDPVSRRNAELARTRPEEGAPKP